MVPTRALLIDEAEAEQYRRTHRQGSQPAAEAVNSTDVGLKRRGERSKRGKRRNQFARETASFSSNFRLCRFSSYSHNVQNYPEEGRRREGERERERDEMREGIRWRRKRGERRKREGEEGEKAGEEKKRWEKGERA